jgi:hypothetical protein
MLKFFDADADPGIFLTPGLGLRDGKNSDLHGTRISKEDHVFCSLELFDHPSAR